MYKPETESQKAREFERMFSEHKVTLEVEWLPAKWVQRVGTFADCWDIYAGKEGLKFKTTIISGLDLYKFLTQEVVNLMPAAQTEYYIIHITDYEHFNIK